MRFFPLSGPVGDQQASLKEIISFMKGLAPSSVDDLRVPWYSPPGIEGYLVCQFVKPFSPLQFDKRLQKYAVICDEGGRVLELVLSYFHIGGDFNFNPHIKTRFYDDMACDMNDAIKNLKVNVSDLIVIQNPVVRYNSLPEMEEGEKRGVEELLTIEVGCTQINGQENMVVKGQCIDVWQYTNEFITKTLALDQVSQCIDRVNVTSLNNLKKSSFEEQDKAILSYFIKPLEFWKEKCNINKALCLFREIDSNGKLNTFFKTVIHGNFATQFHQAVKEEFVVPGDIIAFVNPKLFAVTSYKPTIFSGEVYSLHIGVKKEEKIVFCKANQQIVLTESPKTKQLTTSSVLTSLQEDHKGSTNSNSLQIPPVDVVNTTKPTNDLYQMPISILNPSKNPLTEKQTTPSVFYSLPIEDMKCANGMPNVDDTTIPDESFLIPIALVKPSERLLKIENLNLVSGRCNQFCKRMFLYHQIVWNAKKEPLCPTCLVVLLLYPCLEFRAMSVFLSKMVTILLVGKKAENFLQVKCKDILDSSEKRMLAMKVLETKYFASNKYNPYRLKVSEVSFYKKI